MPKSEQKQEAQSTPREIAAAPACPRVGDLKMVAICQVTESRLDPIGDLLRLGEKTGVLRALSFLPFAPISTPASVAEELAKGMDSKEGVSVGALVATAAIGAIPFGRVAHRVGLDKLFTSGISGIAGKLEAKLAHDDLPALLTKAKVAIAEALDFSPQLAARLEKNEVSTIIRNADPKNMSLEDFRTFSTAVRSANTTLRTYSLAKGPYWKSATLPGFDPAIDAIKPVSDLTNSVVRIQNFADEALRRGKFPLD